MGKVIGIDLGTTNCCVAVMEGGVPQVIPNKDGGRTTPSIVGFTEKGERLVGQIAKRQAVTNPRNTIYAVKRLIGRKFKSPEVQNALRFLPYEVTEAANGDVRVRVRDRDYSPPEISAMVLAKLKEMGEEFLEDEIAEAIITVPAYFDDSQRQATKDAGRIAGLKVSRIINEPTAASLAYRLSEQAEKRIVVYDLGGGTFDVSILQLGDGVFEVKATSGDTFLGGEDFDQRIVDWLLGEFQKKEGIDLKGDRLALQRLKEAAEKSKCELSLESRAEINLPFIAADAKGPKHLNCVLTREQFEGLVVDLVEQTRKPCLEALKMAGLKPLRDGGRITAALASQISDGAAALLIASGQAVAQHNLTPRARIRHLSARGDDPVLMLTAPIPATAHALNRAGLTIDDIDLVEINEAFASVVLAWQRETGADLAKVNVAGGAIALGHPLGATGARLLTTLLHALDRTGGRRGLLTMCEGGGQANVTIVETLL